MRTDHLLILGGMILAALNPLACDKNRPPPPANQSDAEELSVYAERNTLDTETTPEGYEDTADTQTNPTELTALERDTDTMDTDTGAPVYVQNVAVIATGANTRAGKPKCPMMVEEVDVSISNTSNGVAVSFTTEGGKVEDLRSRVRHMAQMYEERRGDGSMKWQRKDRGDAENEYDGRRRRDKRRIGKLPAFDTAIEDIDNGVRVEFVPKDPGKRGELRRKVRRHEERLRSRGCWMPEERGTRKDKIGAGPDGGVTGAAEE